MSKNTSKDTLSWLGFITADIPVLRPTTEAEFRNIRNAGYREASLYEITWSNRLKLAWIEYRNGERRINVRRKQ